MLFSYPSFLLLFALIYNTCLKKKCFFFNSFFFFKSKDILWPELLHHLIVHLCYKHIFMLPFLHWKKKLSWNTIYFSTYFCGGVHKSRQFIKNGKAEEISTFCDVWKEIAYLKNEESCWSTGLQVILCISQCIVTYRSSPEWWQLLLSKHPHA